MANDDSSSSEYETDSDDDSYETDSSVEATASKLVTKKPAIVADDSSSSYETDSDEDDGNDPPKKPVTGTSSTTGPTDDSSESSGDSFGGEIQLSPEEEAKKARMGDEAYKCLQERKQEILLEGKVKLLTAERKKAAVEDCRGAKQEERERLERDLDQAHVAERNEELDRHSTHLIRETRELVRKSSRDMEEMKKVQETINDDLEGASMHWNKEMENFDQMRKDLEFTAKSKEEAASKRKSLEENAYKKKIEVRRLKQDAARRRREEEAEAEETEMRDKERKKKERALAERSSDKARTERAYGWYTKLAFPSRKEMRERVACISNVDISIDDIDLLPWTASQKRVNVAKVNMILFAR
jgi:hypothetical protein